MGACDVLEAGTSVTDPLQCGDSTDCYQIVNATGTKTITLTGIPSGETYVLSAYKNNVCATDGSHFLGSKSGGPGQTVTLTITNTHLLGNWAVEVGRQSGCSGGSCPSPYTLSVN